MKLSCEIVKDLLPLYEEEICSEETKKAVEEHLKECKNCRSFLEDVHGFPEEEIQRERNQDVSDEVVVKSFKKIRLRWMYSIILIIILIPTCYLGWNQIHGRGVHFTNLRELYIGHNFVKQLQLGDYEEAFKYLNLKDKKVEFNYLGNKKLENFEDRAFEVFIKSAEKLQAVGGIQEFEYKGIIDMAEPHEDEYYLTYRLVIDGKNYFADFHVSNNGIACFGSDKSFKEDPFDYLGMWSEWLWEDLNGCYLDFETNEYVYY